MIYGCEGNLRSDLVEEILEHIIVKILGIVDCYASRDTVAADDVFPEDSLVVEELTFVMSFALIHFVKYSTAIIVKV
jgi:hypothetical protein